MKNQMICSQELRIHLNKGLDEMKENIQKSLEFFKPCYCTVTKSHNGLRVCVASDQFEGMSNKERVSEVQRHLNMSVPSFNDVKISYFVMSTDEYRNALKCPTFTGV